jgi:hypothetical protein
MGDNEAARAAVQVAYSFWRALAKDDDDALPAVCSNEFLLHHGGPGPGTADRLRQLLGLDRAECAAMGVTNMVRRLDDGGLIALSLLPRGLGLQVFGLNGPEFISRAWPLLVCPTAEAEVQRVIGYVDLEGVRHKIVEWIRLDVEIPATGPLQ